MALEGSIQTFELAEIFQMIHRQKKEGILALVRGKEGILVQFKAGRIIKASEAEEEDDLLNLLLKSEHINLKDVKIALDEQKRIKQPLAKILLSHDMVTIHQLKRLTRLQTEEKIFNLFEWKSGKYKFDEKKVSYNAEHIEPVSIEFVLMEGVRRLDEWPLLRKKIPSPQVTFEIAAGYSEQENKEPEINTDDEASFADIGGSPGPGEEKEIQKAAWLLKQVKKDLNVQEMIDMAEMGAFSVYKELVDLLSQGKIKKKKGEVEVNLASSSRSIKDIERRDKMKKMVVGGVVMGMTCFLLALSYPSILITLNASDQSIQEVQKLTAWNEIDLIRHHLDIYRLRNGHYPATLQDPIFKDAIQAGSLNLEHWKYRANIEDKTDPYHLELK